MDLNFTHLFFPKTADREKQGKDLGTEETNVLSTFSKVLQHKRYVLKEHRDLLQQPLFNPLIWRWLEYGQEPSILLIDRCDSKWA